MFRSMDAIRMEETGVSSFHRSPQTLDFWRSDIWEQIEADIAKQRSREPVHELSSQCNIKGGVIFIPR